MIFKIKYLYGAYDDPRILKEISVLDFISSAKARKVKMEKNKRLLKMINLLDRGLGLNKSIVEKY